jgi:hypothetical protein
MGLSFTIAAGPRQRTHSRVRVPWDSLPYFTVSDLRLPILSPPTTRGATVEVFDPASTRDTIRNLPVTVLRQFFADWIGTPSRTVGLSCKRLVVAARITVCLVVAMETLLSVAQEMTALFRLSGISSQYSVTANCRLRTLKSAATVFASEDDQCELWLSTQWKTICSAWWTNTAIRRCTLCLSICVSHELTTAKWSHYGPHFHAHTGDQISMAAWASVQGLTLTTVMHNKISKFKWLHSVVWSRHNILSRVWVTLDGVADWIYWPREHTNRN